MPPRGSWQVRNAPARPPRPNTTAAAVDLCSSAAAGGWSFTPTPPHPDFFIGTTPDASGGREPAEAQPRSLSEGLGGVILTGRVHVAPGSLARLAVTCVGQGS